MRLTKSKSKKYLNLFKSIEIRKDKLKEVNWNLNLVLKNKSRYVEVAKVVDIPWFLIGTIHLLESGCNFKSHLHNGDPLTGRTVQVPVNRPVKGKPPFTWEESAEDALREQGLTRIRNWTLPRILYSLEKYNGPGYHNRGLNSPYLWSFSNHFAKGKYVADGKFDPDAISKQCGGAVILHMLEKMGEIPKFDLGQVAEPVSFSYSRKKVKGAKDLQKLLNKLNDEGLKVDGVPGKKTSTACKTMFGYYLKGDPRNEG